MQLQQYCSILLYFFCFVDTLMLILTQDLAQNYSQGLCLYFITVQGI